MAERHTSTKDHSSVYVFDRLNPHRTSNLQLGFAFSFYNYGLVLFRTSLFQNEVANKSNPSKMIIVLLTELTLTQFDLKKILAGRDQLTKPCNTNYIQTKNLF